jgi:integrase
MRQSFQRACRRVETEFAEAGTSIDLSDVTPYDLRHSHATELLRATGDPHKTQRLMLHRELATTLRYVRAAVDPVLEAALEQFRKRALQGTKRGAKVAPRLHETRDVTKSA